MLIPMEKGKGHGMVNNAVLSRRSEYQPDYMSGALAGSTPKRDGSPQLEHSENSTKEEDLSAGGAFWTLVQLPK